MNFSLKMLATILAIWTIRTATTQKLNTSEVVRIATKFYRNEVAKQKGVHASKVPEKEEVKRTTIYAKAGAPEWKAIRRAIDGEPPLPGQEGVEEEIAKFEKLDAGKVLKGTIVDLNEENDRLIKKVRGLNEEREEFETKAYSTQHIAFRMKFDYEKLQAELQSTETLLNEQRDLRDEYQKMFGIKAKELDNLKKRLRSPEMSASSSAAPLVEIFSPDIEDISIADMKAAIKEYNSRRSDTWSKFLSTITAKKVTRAYLVFHTFNIPSYETRSFLERHVSFSGDGINLLFSCYQPSVDGRATMFKEARNLLPLSPNVILIQSEVEKKNVTNIDSNKRDTSLALHDHVNKKDGDFVDVIEEGYESVQVVRG